MTAKRRAVTPYAAPRIVRAMATHDHDNDDKRPAEGMFIGDALQRIAGEMGIPNARQFALRFGLHYKHLNNLWTNTRHAGMPSIVEIAKKTGRAVAYFFGEQGVRAVLGVMDAAGRITMHTREKGPGLIQLPEACPPYFEAGQQLVYDPAPHRYEAWLVVRSIATDEVWLAWSRDHAGLPLLVRPGGETIIYSPTTHDVLGAVVGIIAQPPAGPSA